MGLSDEELEAVHSVVWDEAYYGDDYIVYGAEGAVLRAALVKIEAALRERYRR